MERLTEQELQHYKEHGYILYKKPVLPAEKFAELESRFNRHYEEHPNTDCWDCPHWNDPWFLDLLCDKEILDKLVEPIIGPNIAIWASSFLYKAPFTGKATPWHEDSSYFAGRLDNFDNMVTIWLALDPSTRDNGCMKVIPGTHKNGFSEYEEIDTKENMFHLQIKDTLDESKAVYFELDKNECSFHDSRMIHGGGKNLSPTRRCGFQLRYFPTSVKFNPDHEYSQGFKIYLARGKDLAGNPYSNI
ncbi:MAG TPA: phytanoyl-CoA dioxygenase family protein [Bacilli bacterium]